MIEMKNVLKGCFDLGSQKPICSGFSFESVDPDPLP